MTRSAVAAAEYIAFISVDLKLKTITRLTNLTGRIVKHCALLYT